MNMKKLQLLLAISLIVNSLSFIKCSTENNLDTDTTKLDRLSFSHSTKGWELYSWPNGNTWNYSITEGTNRLKTYDEVTTNAAPVVGKDSLMMLLDKFPANEEIFWISEVWLDRIWGGNYGDLSLPDSNTIIEIENYCIHKELILSISD